MPKISHFPETVVLKLRCKCILAGGKNKANNPKKIKKINTATTLGIGKPLLVKFRFLGLDMLNHKPYTIKSHPLYWPHPLFDPHPMYAMTLLVLINKKGIKKTKTFLNIWSFLSMRTKVLLPSYFFKSAALHHYFGSCSFLCYLNWGFRNAEWPPLFNAPATVLHCAKSRFCSWTIKCKAFDNIHRKDQQESTCKPIFFC